MQKMGKHHLKLSTEALSLLMAADLPGNVRQLENLVERAVTLADDDMVLPPDFFRSTLPMFYRSATNSPGSGNRSGKSLKDITESMEKFYIVQALEEFHGNITRVAQKLGLSRLGLHKKMQRYQINPAEYKQS